jgi:hypothetical protein
VLSSRVEEEAATVDALEGVDDMARWLQDALDARKALSILIGDVEQELAARMPDKQMEVPGVGLIERSKKAKRSTWDSDALYREIRRRPDALDVFERCAPLTGSLGWRKSELRKAGIDPDDYCSTEWSDRYAIRFHGGGL